MSVNEGNILTAMAWVVGTLRRVHEVATSVSLAALNARVIAARAGVEAQGFVPITRSVDGLARDVDQAVSHIERAAVRSARSAAAAFIVAQRLARFELARRRIEAPSSTGAGASAGSVSRPGLEQARRRFQSAQVDRAQELRLASSALLRDLDRIDALLRSSLTLSTLSRIEASRSGGYRAELAAVGDAIDQAADVIRTATTECRARLLEIGV